MATKSKTTKPALQAAPLGGMFANAGVIENSVKVSTSRDQREEVTLIGIEKYAKYDAVQKAADSAKTMLGAELKNKVFDLFLAKGGDKRPDSFTASEGIGRANVQLKKKASNVALSEADVKMLREAGVEPHKDTVVTELFAINPVHIADKNLMAKVEAALQAIAGLPADFIVRQVETVKYVVTDAVADAAWKTGDPDVIEATTSISFAATVAKVDAEAMGDTIRELFNIEQPTIEQLLAKLAADSKEADKVAKAVAKSRAAEFKVAKAAKAAASKVSGVTAEVK